MIPMALAEIPAWAAAAELAAVADTLLDCEMVAAAWRPWEDAFTRILKLPVD
jgi:hypothetical protein